MSIRLVDGDENHLEGFEFDHVLAYSAANVAFSADEKYVAFPISLDVILIYDIDAKKERRLKGHQGPCTALAFSPNGKTLVTAGDFFHEWDLTTGKMARRVEFKSARERSAEDFFHAWKLATENMTRRVETKPDQELVECIVFAPDGKHFVAFADSCLRSWNVEAMKPTWSMPCSGGRFTISPDGKYLAVVDHAKIVLRDVAGGREVNQPANLHIGALVRMTADGRSLLSKSVNANPARFDMWKILNGERIGENLSPKLSLDRATFTRNGDWAITQSIESHLGVKKLRLKTWNANSGELQFAINVKALDAGFGTVGPSYSSWLLAIAETGNRIALVDEGKLTVWNLNRTPIRSAWSLEARDYDINNPEYWQMASISKIAFSPDGKMIQVQKQVISRFGGRPLIRVNYVDADSGRPCTNFEKTLERDTDNFGWSEFSPDSNLLAFKGDENGVQICDIRFEQLLHTVAKDRHAELCIFAPNSRSVAITDQGRISIWEGATGGMRQEWQAHVRPINTLLYSPDGRYLISQGPEDSALVWDLHVVGLKPSPQRRSPDDLWQELGVTDSARAHQASMQLLRQPQEFLALARQRLGQAPVVSDKQIQSWIADLESNRFATRDQAMRSLQANFEQARDLIEAVRKGPLPLESVRRLDQLLESASKATQDTDRLRTDRAVELLEQLGGRDAVTILREARQGNPYAPLTRHAKEALERMQRIRE